jgi:nucleoid DNA-binding protein
MGTITKRDLVVRISSETGMIQQEVFDIVQKTLDTITDCLADGDDVILRNFGAFQVKLTKEKVGRNPNKPETNVTIPPRAIVKFKPGKEMKERVMQLSGDLAKEEEKGQKKKKKAS